MPLMRIGTITSTLKRSRVDSLHAAGGPLLKGRNVSCGFESLQINNSQRLHIILPSLFTLRCAPFLLVAVMWSLK